MTKENDRLLGELHGKLDQFIERYSNDREETTKRYEVEREERKQWRDDIHQKVQSLDEKIAPVVRDHQIIVRGGKWVVATVASGFAFVKGWVFIKDHFK